jgi:regulator of sigma E protease
MTFATNFATGIVGFIIVLGFLIFAHESGHFFMAKLFKVRVLVFSFGFGKRLFGFRKGATDYRVSMIPLGGYVRMAGDNPEENQPQNPDEFLSKPKWQRLLILVAGPVMNLVIAILFVTGLSMIAVPKPVGHPILGEVQANMPAAKAGLKVGDRITKIDGDSMNDFEDIRMSINMHPGDTLRVEVLRNGVPIAITLTPKKEETDYGPIGRAGIGSWTDPVVAELLPGSAALKAGIRPGDRIVAVNGKPIFRLEEYDLAAIAVKGAAIPLEIQRGAERLKLTIPAVKYDPDDPMRGVIPPYRLVKLSLPQAFAESVRYNLKMVRFTFNTLKRLVRGGGSMKELSGPITIARISGKVLKLGWLPLISLMAMISLQLGIMNLLPIPVLDGGHIFILLIEGVARRELSLPVKERIQQLGFAVLAVIMIVVMYNDVIINITRKG